MANKQQLNEGLLSVIISLVDLATFLPIPRKNKKLYALVARDYKNLHSNLRSIFPNLKDKAQIKILKKLMNDFDSMGNNLKDFLKQINADAKLQEQHYTAPNTNTNTPASNDSIKKAITPALNFKPTPTTPTTPTTPVTPAATNTSFTPPDLYTANAESTSTPTINAPVITKAPTELELRQQMVDTNAAKTPDVYKDTSKEQMKNMAQGNELLSLVTNRGSQWESYSKLDKMIMQEIREQSIPTKIGFKGTPDFEHGLVREFFKFFYLSSGNQPVGAFKDMADMVHDRYGGNLDKDLGKVGEISQNIYDYFYPPNGQEPPYDLNNLLQKGAAEAVWKYMTKVNKLAKAIDASVSRGGAAEKGKVKQGLKGLLGMLERAQQIFTSNFGSKKTRRIGFKFRGDK